MTESTQDALCDAGGVSAILKGIRNEEFGKVRGQLIAALWSVTKSSNRARDQVIKEEEGLPTLFSIIQTALNNGDGKASNDEFEQEQAVGILRNIIQNDAQNQNAIAQESFPILKELLSNKNPQLQVRSDLLCSIFYILYSIFYSILSDYAPDI